MDATVATGAAAIMAIRVLLDHEVVEEHISLCSLLMTEQGKRQHSWYFGGCSCSIHSFFSGGLGVLSVYDMANIL